jgi:hypothetical protein
MPPSRIRALVPGGASPRRHRSGIGAGVDPALGCSRALAPLIDSDEHSAAPSGRTAGTS